MLEPTHPHLLAICCPAYKSYTRGCFECLQARVGSESEHLSNSANPEDILGRVRRGPLFKQLPRFSEKNRSDPILSIFLGNRHAQHRQLDAQKVDVPNASCRERDELVAFIGCKAEFLKALAQVSSRWKNSFLAPEKLRVAFDYGVL